MLQPKEEEEEPSGDKVLESDQEKMSHGLQPEREPSELKAVKAVEENGEQEAEPVRNGAESVSEGEGTDAASGCTESSGEGPVYQYKPGRSCSVCFSASLLAGTPSAIPTGVPTGAGRGFRSAEICNPAGPKRSSRAPKGKNGFCLVGHGQEKRKSLTS